MTATLPEDVCAVFDRFLTTEYVTVDRRGQPIVWPVTPYHRRDRGWIDVTTGLGYPKKADDARADPRVALLFSDPTGSGLDDPPAVLVQGTADVDDRDLDANRERYWAESSRKLPGMADAHPPAPLRRLFSFYYTRIYVHVRPERVLVWPRGDVSAEPALFSDHLEEVRSGHNEEPESPPAEGDGGPAVWDRRLDALGTRDPTAVLAVVAPDGFPFAVRLPVEAQPGERRIRLHGAPTGVPLAPGRACLVAHAHDPSFSWQRNFQVRGDLVRDGDAWALVPRRLVGGFEAPRSRLAMYRQNARRMWRMARRARAEQQRRRLPAG